MLFSDKYSVISGQVKLILMLFLFLPTIIFSQDQDSLLKKINDIDISLDEPINSEEDLYMNTVSFQSFYDALSPMGEWIQITKEDVDDDLSDGEGEGLNNKKTDQDEEFLFIWKPEVDKNWKPYVNGKWEYTDHGWLWVSSDKWGNSTYNYGRWWNSTKYGWVWLPGYTWAPAWVKWKVSNDDKYVGWIALSPKAKWNSDKGITEETYKYKNKDNEWIFVENNNFAGDISSDKTVKQSEYSALVKNSSSITDIKTEEDKIVNKGPDVNRMEEKTGKKFLRKQIKFSRNNSTAIIGENDVVVGKHKFDRTKTPKEKISRPNKFRKSERVKRIIKHRNNPNRPPVKH